MPRNSNRTGKNNNPSGRNQYSDWGVMELARERPIAAAATAVGAAAAGLFLWSRRTQISDQMSSLSNQLGEWKSDMMSGSANNFEASDENSSSNRRGGGDTNATARSRGQAKSEATT